MNGNILLLMMKQIVMTDSHVLYPISFAPFQIIIVTFPIDMSIYLARLESCIFHCKWNSSSSWLLKAPHLIPCTPMNAHLTKAPFSLRLFISRYHILIDLYRFPCWLTMWLYYYANHFLHSFRIFFFLYFSVRENCWKVLHHILRSTALTHSRKEKRNKNKTRRERQ